MYLTDALGAVVENINVIAGNSPSLSDQICVIEIQHNSTIL
jgi:hypothetical protein